MNRSRRATSLVLALAILGGCQTERIEYHRRPAFYEAASGDELPDRVVLDDGTVVIYRDRPDAGYEDSMQFERGGGGGGGEADADDDGEAKVFEPREEDDEGNVVLRAILPEHVIANTLWCVRAEEYEPLWEQLVADRTKADYSAVGEGYEEFAAYFEENRRELARTLNRMLIGWSREDVSVDKLEGNVFRCRLRRRVGADFQYTTVYVVVEGLGMRLLTIR